MEVGSLIPSLLTNRVDFIALFVTELPTLRAKAADVGKKVGAFYFSDWGVDAYNNGIVVHEDPTRSSYAAPSRPSWKAGRGPSLMWMRR